MPVARPLNPPITGPNTIPASRRGNPYMVNAIVSLLALKKYKITDSAVNVADVVRIRILENFIKRPP